jgi:hypothetical protein
MNPEYETLRCHCVICQTSTQCTTMKRQPVCHQYINQIHKPIEQWYTIWSKISGHPFETVIRLFLWHTSKLWTLILGGPTLCLYDSLNSAGEIFSTRCLNVSGGMAAHSSCRAVARAVSNVGRWGMEWSQRSHSSHRCLWDSGQDSGLASPFLEHCCPQPFPHRPWFMAGSIVMLIQTIVITELVFYHRQYATGQNALVFFCIYISVQYYERAKFIPWKTPPHCNATSSKFHCWDYTC